MKDQERKYQELRRKDQEIADLKKAQLDGQSGAAASNKSIKVLIFLKYFS